MLYLLIIAGILLELIVLVGGVYLCLKHWKKPTEPGKVEVKVSGKNITSEVIRDGVKDAIREIAFEDEQQKQMEQKQRVAESIYSSFPKDEPVRNSGGNLVPYGLTEAEKEALEMFLGKE